MFRSITIICCIFAAVFNTRNDEETDFISNSIHNGDDVYGNVVAGTGFGVLQTDCQGVEFRKIESWKSVIYKSDFAAQWFISS